MSLFDVPHPATAHGKPVLWFGVVVVSDEGRDSVAAIVANPAGRLVMEQLENVIADVRYISNREGFVAGVTGPGWVDLEDIEGVKQPEKIAELLGGAPNTPDDSITPAPAATNAMIEGTDYITDKEGHWFHPETGQELDKSTGQPIE